MDLLSLYRLDINGVTDGARTRDHRNHNPGLYQLSYNHRSRNTESNSYVSAKIFFYKKSLRSAYNKAIDLILEMVRPAGLEPATTRLEGGCSIQLSYGRV